MPDPTRFYSFACFSSVCLLSAGPWIAPAQHGFCENLYRYEHVLPSFADKGIYVTAYDQRGYGVTAEKGMPGKWPKETYSNTSLTLLLDDLNQMILGERQRMDNKYGPGVVPFFLMGHSMGGQLALSAVTRPANSPHLPPSTVEGLAGVIGSAPWLKLSMPPPKPVLEFGKFLLKLFPDHPWINPVTPKKLCKDKVVLADLRKSPYTRRRIYLRAGEEPTLNGLDVLNDKYTNFPPHLPLLIIHGERDPVVSPSGSVAFDKKVKADDKTLIFYKGHLHEPLQERLEERTKVANTIIS